MTAAPLPTGRRSRLASWFGAASDAPNAPAIASVPVPADTRLLVERRMYDDIGEFLFTHRLSPTPANFEIAHAYLTGSDPAIAARIAAMLADGGTLDPDAVAGLIDDMRHGGAGTEMLSDLAGQLEAHLAVCLRATDRTQSSARDYGDALDAAQDRLDADPTGTLAHIAGLTREVVSTTRLVETELKQTRREAQRLRNDLDRARDAAERDHLTGLANRRGFERVLADRSARANVGRHAAVALCDIDDFKRVNDVHGHAAGDRVLKFVGSFLADQLGEAVHVARHGGEEFAVLIDDRSPHEAMMLLDAVREKLAARSLVNQETGASIGRITFSAGVAALGDDAVRALGAADAALYQAKHGGKNDVVVAPAALQAKFGAGGR